MGLEAIKRVPETVEDWFNGINRKRDERLFQQTGSEEILLNIANELREGGDSSALVLKDRAPKHASLVLRWNLTDRGQSRGIRIVPTFDHTGVSVEFQNQSGMFINLRDSNEFYSYLRSSGQKEGDIPLRDQALFAMRIAFPGPDYRHGRVK